MIDLKRYDRREDVVEEWLTKLSKFLHDNYWLEMLLSGKLVPKHQKGTLLGDLTVNGTLIVNGFSYVYGTTGITDQVLHVIERRDLTQNACLVINPPGTLSAANVQWFVGMKAGSGEFSIGTYPGTGANFTSRITIDAYGVLTIPQFSAGGSAVGVDTFCNSAGELYFGNSRIERAVNRNATNGYAGLTAGKITSSLIPFGTGSTQVCAGDDARLSDSRTPNSHVHAAADVTGTAVVTADPRLDKTLVPDAITATSAGIAASVSTRNTEVTTDGDSGEDNVTLAAGTVGQVKNIYCKAVGNAADSLKVTPGTMIGGTKISFAASPLGKGCTLVYTSSGWVCIGTQGGVVS